MRGETSPRGGVEGGDTKLIPKRLLSNPSFIESLSLIKISGTEIEVQPL